jgi:hypothetical protein
VSSLPAPLPVHDSSTPATTGLPCRVLAVILDRDDLVEVLPAALAAARDDHVELHIALIRPEPPETLEGALNAALLEHTAHEVVELRRRARAAAADSGVAWTIDVHFVSGLRGRRRHEVLEHAVDELAWRYDARPLGRWAQ